MNVSLRQIDNHRWLIPRSGAMRVDGLVFSSPQMIKTLAADPCLQQVANVAMLPGIVGRSLAMPDIHWGYGFPIGGVAAFDSQEGVVSPGGVGYDINCGCRLMTTRLSAGDLQPRLKEVVISLFKHIPTGVGSTGRLNLSKAEIQRVARLGAEWAVQQGMGERRDLEHTEDLGRLESAEPDVVSERAIKRGRSQLGTLGSGNHFLEIQVVDRVLDSAKARFYNLFEGQITLMLHSGSRGFGHQICDDFLKEMTRLASQESLELPDRQLTCAPLRSDLGRRYLAAMACAANFAWANRQVLMHLAHQTLLQTLELPPRELGLELLYDVCHNIAKLETHEVSGNSIMLCVHRKGATRSLPAGHPLVPAAYARVGQPVLIPGDMGTHSYVLAGAPGAMNESFGSCCHGAGRLLSRSQAIKQAKGRAIHRELEDRGILVHSRGKHTLKEEMPEAYKDVSQVVEVVEQAGLATAVARLRPIGVIKG